MKKILCAGLLAMSVVTQAYADDVKVSNAWARATAPGQDSASLQMTLTSKKDATLIGVGSGKAQSGEIHTMVMEGDVMKMRAIESVALPAKTPVTLGEDGNHLMLIGLREPLKAGRKLPCAVTVKFADGSTKVLRILAQIKPLETPSIAAQPQPVAQAAAQPATQQHEHHHH
ncbi:MAG: copper chaperone PCu(A)C [Gallionella sp.]|nr:copper chaperone PCu(A)C [Gallionella sp.]